MSERPAPQAGGTFRLESHLSAVKALKKKAFIPYLCAGDPDLRSTEFLVEALVEAGADAVELGVPFSDPVADGPVIQAAGQRALAAGTTLVRILETVAALRSRVHVPLVLMTYFNPLLSYGVERLGRDAACAGVDGFIVPDLPHDESGELRAVLGDAGICLVPLVAPTTPVERLVRVTAAGRGFVYCVSLAGVTGARSGIAKGLPEFMARVRSATDKPLCIGFGVSSPDQARAMAVHGDGVVVGSALVQKVAEHCQDIPAAVAAVSDLARSIRAAVSEI